MTEVIAMTESSEPTIIEVLAQLAASGYGGAFRIDEGTVPPGLHCGTCQHRVLPDHVRVAETWRFEGPTDPDDEAIILAFTCPRCQTGGVLISSYGPETPSAEADVIAALARSRPTGGGTGGHPADPTDTITLEGGSA